MRRRISPIVIFLCALLIACGVALAAQMTGKDVIRLKKLGFSDAEIKTAVEKSDGKVEFTDADIQELKAAGGSDELIAVMKQAGNKPLSVQAIVEMSKAGKPIDEIIDAMAACPSRYALSAREAVDLSAQNVPPAILLALKGRPLGLAELKLLSEGKPAASIYQKLAAYLGFAKQDLTPADALALSQAGVPDDVVAALKVGRAATAGPAPAGGDLKEYRHIAGYFTARYPQDWKLIRDVESGEVRYCFTPELDKTKGEDVDVDMSIHVYVEDMTSPFAGKDAAGMLKHIIPSFRASEPNVLTQGEVMPAMLGKLPAARIALRGTPRKRTAIFDGELYLAVDHNMIYSALIEAPESKYPQYKQTLERMLAQSDFGQRPPSLRGPTQEAGDIINRYKDSVVCVMAIDENGDRSSGTGFIVQKNGYIATNAHVAVDLATGKRHAKYLAQWDVGSGHADMPLTFVGCRFHPSRLALHHGVDVAMFKLPPGEYTPVPLTPLSDVHLGDAVITMGFPHVFDFATRDLFTTGGVVTRFNRALDGTIESLYMDAKITHGNSGGPCFSRVTGGVIGLNTFGMPIQTSQTQMAQHLNDLVGYSGVVPADVLMAEFPVQTELGLDPDGNQLDFTDCYDLAGLYQNMDRHRAAIEMARKAVKLEPQSADAYCMLGACLLTAARQTGAEVNNLKPTVADAITAMEQALTCQPDHENSLVMLSMLYLNNGDLIKAMQFADRAVKAHDEDFQPHYQQAIIYEALRRFDEALVAANKAKELAHDVRADSHILCGQILYAQGKFDEGKAEYIQASAIHPTNLAARLGIGEYYELKRNYQSALVEYGRVDADLPHNPAVLECLGRSYMALNKYDQAIDDYQKCIARSGELGQSPEADLFLTLGHLAYDIKKKAEMAADVYAQGLTYYGAMPIGAQMHLRLAHIFKDAGIPGIAFADLSRAISLDPQNADVKTELASGNLPRMSMDDIETLIHKIGFPTALIADMVEHTPLNFRVDPKDAQQMGKLEESGVEIPIVVAILNSNKQFPPENQGPAPAPNGWNGPPDSTPRPADAPSPDAPAPDPMPAPRGDAAHPAVLFGVWITTYQADKVGAVTMTISFESNGHFSLEQSAVGMDPYKVKGQWHVEQRQIVTISDADGATASTAYQVDGDVLQAQVAGVGMVKFNRRP